MAAVAAGCSLVAGVLAVLGAPTALVVAVAIAASAVSAALAGALLGRVRGDQAVVSAAGAIASGDLSARVSAGTRASDSLVSAFNDMAARLEALVESAGTEKNRLLAALNSSTDAVVAVDRDARIVFANSAAHQLFRRGGASLVGNPFVWLLPDQQVVEALRASREEGRRETRIVERPGKQYYQTITTPIVAGGDWAALAVFHDITEVKRVEQVRRDFVANVSHELRTPLAALKAVIETLHSAALEDKAIAEEFLDRADGEIDRLVQMVEELLELSRIESGEMTIALKSVDIQEVLANSVARLQPQAEKAGLQVDLDVNGPLPSVEGDAQQLERVVVNLVHNALKFTPAGGKIRVSAARTEDGLTVEVEDNGAGILPEDVPRVFERFFKADRARGGSGTGLGLAVARHTIEAHGGHISVASRPEEGSKFTIVLPAKLAEDARS
jgi:two-component system phosphate regulon sensor histidine kinase PhoR